VAPKEVKKKFGKRRREVGDKKLNEVPSERPCNFLKTKEPIHPSPHDRVELVLKKVTAERTDAERGKKNKEVVKGACNKQDRFVEVKPVT
jgi:hypothetical protein